MTAMQGGSTTCKVSVENDDYVFDTFKVDVVLRVTPTSPINLHLGGIINFKIHNN